MTRLVDDEDLQVGKKLTNLFRTPCEVVARTADEIEIRYDNAMAGQVVQTRYSIERARKYFLKPEPRS